MNAPMSTNHHKRIAHLAATCACIALRRTTRAVTNYYDNQIKQQAGLRITQVTMLVVAYLAGPQTINEMADKLDLDRTTLTRNLKPLEQDGLIATAPGSDQRTRVVTLTLEGQHKLFQVLPLWEEAQAHMVSGIGQEHFTDWLAQLDNVALLVQNGM